MTEVGLVFIVFFLGGSWFEVFFIRWRKILSFLIYQGWKKTPSKQMNPSGSAGEESVCRARDTGHVGSTPGLGRSPGGGNGNHPGILTWKIPWTEEPDGLQFKGLQRVRYSWALNWNLTNKPEKPNEGGCSVLASDFLPVLRCLWDLLPVDILTWFFPS